MLKTLKKCFPFVLALAIGLMPFFAFAQVGVILPCAKDGNALDCNKWSSLVEAVNGFVDLLFRLAVIAASLSFAYAGFLYLTAVGDQSKISKAHGIFTNVAVGFIIMLSAWLLVKLVLRLAGPEYDLLK